MSTEKIAVNRYLPDQTDVTIGEVRVVIAKSGLIGLHRDDESLTLVPTEAIAIAQHLLEQFADRVALERFIASMTT